MDPVKRREIASTGGKAAQKLLGARSRWWITGSNEAKEMGRKGGLASKGRQRTGVTNERS